MKKCPFLQAFKFLICVCLGTGLGACAATFPDMTLGPDLDGYHEKWKDHARVASNGINGVFGRFVLLRRGNDACALRVVAARRGRDAKTASNLQTGDENVFADYEWHYQADGSADFSKPNIKSGRDKLHEGPALGNIHFFAIRTSTNTALSCGPFAPRWGYPTAVWFDTYEFGGGLKTDKLVEMAVTGWQRIEQVRFDDARLQWVRANNRSDQVILRLDQLPQ